MAKGCGFIQYDSLPGEIKTGCTQTPKLGKRFCVQHLMDHQELDKITDPTLKEVAGELGECLGPVLRSSKKKEDMITWGQVAEILDMRTLRNKKLFKVRWMDVEKGESWEPECNIPTALREKIERGDKNNMLTVWDISTMYGMTSVRSYQVSEKENVPTVKRRRLSVGNCNTESNRRTIFIDTPEDSVQNCKTEKSKHVQRKNFRTAGTFFGMKPCGIILFAYELFISESKSQVYGLLHDVFTKWELDEIERIVYDDACHLKKFCCNPVRQNVTGVSKRLADLDMVVDKMHFRNHVDRWCKSNCNPYDRPDLDGVDTEVCEQTFA